LTATGPAVQNARVGSGDTTRWSLIRAASEGDAAARDEFARRYQTVIRAYLGARWRGTRLLDHLDDAAQETFLRCFEDHGALERADPDRGDFRGYLYGVTRNVARRFEEGRGLGREAPAASRLESFPADDERLSVVFDRAWAMAIVREALRRLSELARVDGEDAMRRVEILRLRFRDDLPVREIARRWGEDPTRIHRAYARARREYERTLREVVGELPAGGSVDEECARLLDVIRRD
jgi:RNA polymerase sigma-70 factor (ECF subfamily)